MDRVILFVMVILFLGLKVSYCGRDDLMPRIFFIKHFTNSRVFDCCGILFYFIVFAVGFLIRFNVFTSNLYVH